MRSNSPLVWITSFGKNDKDFDEIPQKLRNNMKLELHIVQRQQIL